MNNKGTLWTGIAAAAAMVLLILDTKTAFQGAYDGIQLCIATVIPSLFPFMILSGIITKALGGRSVPFLKLPGKICRIPAGSEILLFTGLVGGYPIGARCIAQSYQNGQLTKEDAERMLGFCSNAGPAFIFGMTGALFENRTVPCVLWSIQILSAFIVGTLLPGRAVAGYAPSLSQKNPSASIVIDCIRTMGKICGWILIFRIVIAYFTRWFLWLFPKETAVLLQGIMELSNGCIGLSAIDSEATRFLLCSCMLSFGGLCVWMQTISVTGNLHTGLYLPGKILQTALSGLLSMVIAPILFPGEASIRPTVITLFFSLIGITECLLLCKKSSGIMKKSVV